MPMPEQQHDTQDRDPEQWLRDTVAAARHDRTTQAEHRLGIHPHDDPKETP
jgi:hypothetical protein